VGINLGAMTWLTTKADRFEGTCRGLQRLVLKLSWQEAEMEVNPFFPPCPTALANLRPPTVN
jgi:hypothetical protein